MEDDHHASENAVLTDTELLELFQLVDTDHGGTISRSEVEHLMKKLDAATTQADLDKIVNDIDLDGNGEIDPHEFVQGFRRHGQISVTQRELKAAFRMFARGSNYLSLTKLRQVLDMYATESARKSPEEMDALMEMLRKTCTDPERFDYQKFIDSQK
ncbi:hypothetical protein PAPYR_5967 [Paratrimastix pyriformis]|uniref:EF-hand domain-containing protein n=1 Tax=Paratrimastix pyriformis TaxID=342808 RepID=A0ABQ8UG97_9EUKA|nr:hypothetical protein PAPYR_5967 [Paratrimastix pyriformis]